MICRTFDDLNKCISKHLHRIPSDIDLIVGIPRSGIIAAGLISEYLNKPLLDIDGFINQAASWGGYYKNVKKGDNCRVLVVDDAIGSGREMRNAKAKLSKLKGVKIVCLAIYGRKKHREFIDLQFEEHEGHRVFEWNLFHHNRYRTCWDIDGVLCPDPPKGVDHPQQAYKEFLKNTETIIVPTYPAKAIVTGRLNIYRAETIGWLRKNNIVYDKLLMKPKEVRSIAHFKAQHYQRIKSQLFIESHASQAAIIARISNKIVFCMENRKFYNRKGIM